LYFQGIEKRFGTQAAAEIDAEVWSAMAKMEATALKRTFNVDDSPDVGAVVGLLKKSSWALDQPFKTIRIDDGLATLRIDRCRTQEARLRKRLGEFPCKRVRLGYLERFAVALNPRMVVKCLVCPPDEHPGDLWCEWELRMGPE